MAELTVKSICNTLCQSGKFETGQGGCAPICMSMLGSSRKPRCDYEEQVHGDLARAILSPVERIVGKVGV